MGLGAPIYRRGGARWRGGGATDRRRRVRLRHGIDGGGGYARDSVPSSRAKRGWAGPWPGLGAGPAQFGEKFFFNIYFPEKQ